VSVWVAVPSARPVAEVNAWRMKWYEMGYAVAIQRDLGQAEGIDCDFLISRPYAGYADAVNYLVKHVLIRDPACNWCVIGGDDVFPDPTKRADEIARECSAHFEDAAWPRCWHWTAGKTLPQAQQDGTAHQEKQALWSADVARIYSTLGVMQPTGDRWGADELWARQRFPDRPAYIDRVAGSAWIGREFAQRAYGGNGPLWSEYAHMFCDEELQCVAEKLGVFWQRRDLTQHHAHWGRDGFTHAAPDFLREANSGGHWAKYGELFARRKAAGFPGSEVL
jgi:hypothetical protein